MRLGGASTVVEHFEPSRFSHSIGCRLVDSQAQLMEGLICNLGHQCHSGTSHELSKYL